MAQTVKFNIRGAKEMERVLKKLGPQTAARVGDKSLRAGAKVIVDEAKRLAPVLYGDLRKSIAVGPGKSSDPGERVVLIGFKRPESAIAHLVEFGTAHSPAQPFMRPAMDTRAGEALDAMGEIMAKGITAEAAKLAKR